MAYRPGLPATVPHEPVGSVAVVDLESACELYGRDMVPFPLGRTRPVGSLWLATRGVHPIEDRLSAGDLRGVRGWVEALMRPDVCVECRVHWIAGDRPDLRLHGVRVDGSAFVAVQGSDGVDVVDVYAVSPRELGAVVADSAGLVGAGAHQRIAVTCRDDRIPDAAEIPDGNDDLSFLADHVSHPDPVVAVVDERDVVATGTVQSRTEPARHRGVDPNRGILRWVQVDGDGDYLYEIDGDGYAEPFDAAMLRSWIEGFIADDLESLCSRRGQW